MKKIAIVTTFWSPNYGAALQAFAMQSFLDSHGYETVFVNRRESTVPPVSKSSAQKFADAIMNHHILRTIAAHVVVYERKLWNSKYADQVNLRNKRFAEFRQSKLHLGPDASDSVSYT